MIEATMTSGQLVPVPKTPIAARTTARLPIASFREQIQTERMFASPVRKQYSMKATPPFAASAAIPIRVIVPARGSDP